MGWFRRTDPGRWDVAAIEPPWKGPAIFEHVRSHISGNKGLAEGGERLPDEKDDGGIRWVAGGMDGAFGHHGGGGSEKSRAKMLHRALRVVLEDASTSKFDKLYTQLLHDGVIDFIDLLLAEIRQSQDLDAERLQALALWIARNSPDREPVKFAIALLGIVSGEDHSELLMTLGRHEEFTLYAAIALANTAEEPENALFELAQLVDGWGRIQIVERLSGTKNPSIKAWMLREGYDNSIMIEYLACTCARAGGLKSELEKPSVDAALLAGAGQIIIALVNGGPAEDMDDYEDGAVVVKRYLDHLGPAPAELSQLVTLDVVQRFLDQQDADWTARERRGWTLALREQLTTRIRAVKSLPHWLDLVREGLSSKDLGVFSRADQAAKALGIDTWDHQFNRLESGIDEYGWYAVMQTDDPARIDRVVALAEARFPLEDIASGPADEMGLGPAWIAHGHLDFVLQDLRRFPGKGWPLIRAGLRSPVIRGRHMALRALSGWGVENWPPEARDLLNSALRAEPDSELRGEIEALLAGKPIDDGQ